MGVRFKVSEESADNCCQIYEMGGFHDIKGEPDSEVHQVRTSWGSVETIKGAAKWCVTNARYQKFAEKFLRKSGFKKVASWRSNYGDWGKKDTLNMWVWVPKKKATKKKAKKARKR